MKLQSQLKMTIPSRAMRRRLEKEMFNPQTQNGVVQYWNIIPYVVFEVSCLREKERERDDDDDDVL